MTDPNAPRIREDLQARRTLLAEAAGRPHDADRLAHLIREVDAALARLDAGTYGVCEECHEAIEPERLLADPVVRFCIDHLPPRQRSALEEDLTLAARIQEGLLPPRGLSLAGWDTAYHYQPAGVVSGDYCDLIRHEGSLHFILGDVSGKGVAAAMLMAHLHATMRPLVQQGLGLERIMATASRVFCESSLANLFATLICGRADPDGTVTLSNGGHDPVLVARGGDIQRLGATGLPLGMCCDEEFAATRVVLEPGDVLFLYSDWLTEALDPAGDEFGMDRVAAAFTAHRHLPPAGLVAAAVADLTRFRRDATLRDDLTLMAIRKT